MNQQPACPTAIPARHRMRRIAAAPVAPGDALAARRAADAAAEAAIGPAMLLAWYDAAAGQGYPDIPECTGKPSWFAYGEGHGAELMVSVNDDAWIFLYLPTGS